MFNERGRTGSRMSRSDGEAQLFGADSVQTNYKLMQLGVGQQSVEPSTFPEVFHENKQQAMLGIFFSAKSAVLIEDVPFTEEDITKDQNPPQNIYSLYNQVGINCFIAAAVYVAVGAVSLCQVRLNKRQEYMVT
ncbi:Ribonuclease kappa-B [Oryzias melastigma]|uniref:Ribonuclease kappa-B n=1 Tax=Oryzias melastigma TaxID=30732 RepID=A0A834FV04_ORYME|nr:Ribonuclease kappa-B [Oryzias melastigma]